jgi:hypothetical protein
MNYIITALFICSIGYEIWYFYRKDGERLSLRTYLKLQLLKVALLYLLVDLIIFANGGWRLQFGSWARSLFGVVVLSIAFG